MNWNGYFCGGRENVSFSVARVLLVLVVVRTDVF